MKTNTLQPTTYSSCHHCGMCLHCHNVWGHHSIASSSVQEINCLCFNSPPIFIAENPTGKRQCEQPEMFYAAVDYKASKEDEVSFLKGEKVEVLKKSLLGWWTVRSVKM